jgi:hypothetical protein
MMGVLFGMDEILESIGQVVQALRDCRNPELTRGKKSE